MKTAPESRKIATILKSLRDESLIPRPEFQRRAVWTNKDKLAFIDTILRGLPFPEIYIASGTVNTDLGEATEILVDGQQRVRTIDEYFRGAFPFKNSKAIKAYSDLTEEEKRDFLNYDVAARNLGLIDEQMTIDVFRRINATSYDLNEFERFNAVYLGEFKKFTETLATEDFFAEIRLFSPNDIRRMKDVLYVASLAATIMSDYFHRDEQVEAYLEQYNEDFPARTEIEGRFQAIFNLLRELELPKNSRAWRKAEFYNLFVELDRRLHKLGRSIELGELRSSLLDFYAKVDAARENRPEDPNVRKYYEATLQNTNDRSQRIARGEALRSLFDGSTAELPGE